MSPLVAHVRGLARRAGSFFIEFGKFWWGARAVTAAPTVVWALLIPTAVLPTIPRGLVLAVAFLLTFWATALSARPSPAGWWRSGLTRQAFSRVGLAPPVRVREVARTSGRTEQSIRLSAGVTVESVRRQAPALASALRCTSVEVVPDSRRADRLTLRIVRAAEISPVEAADLARCVGTTPFGPAIWDPLRAPHLLVVGDTGSGKTTAMVQLMVSLLVDSWNWHFAVVDLKGVSFGPLATSSLVTGCAIDPLPAAELIRDLAAEVYRRRDLLLAARAEHWTGLPPGTIRPVLVAVDETAELLGAGSDTETAKERRERLDQIRADLATLARLGRYVGIHLLLGLQRPDAAILGGELRDNLRARVALGRLSPDGLRMVFPEAAMDVMVASAPGAGYANGLVGMSGVVPLAVPYRPLTALWSAFGADCAAGRPPDGGSHA